MRTLWKPTPFDAFCEEYLDGLYCSKLPIDEQCSGYYKLKEMVLSKIEPATKEECMKMLDADFVCHKEGNMVFL
jgi:hypothetical protein